MGIRLSRNRQQRVEDAPAPAAEEKAAPAVPDYMLDPNAVLKDNVTWRDGQAPDYSKANENFRRERTNDWEAGSLPDLVSNLVKNWEKEASYKPNASEWRTIDHKAYKFSCNGGPTSTAEEMIKVGTYNALIGENPHYSSKAAGFEDSHTVFRTALPDGFSWEVLEVYSGPPTVAFKWRHWGHFTGALKCPLGFGKFSNAPPTNKMVEIFGITVARVTPEFKITDLEIFYDPNQMFAAMIPAGIPAAATA